MLEPALEPIRKMS